MTESKQASQDCCVLATGVFLYCHEGHQELLKFCAEIGKVTVGINGDGYTAQKYKEIPISIKDRIQAIMATGYVDKIIVFDEDNPSTLIRAIRPVWFVKGPDYLGSELLEMQAIKEVGTKLVIHKAIKKNSSTMILKKARKLNLV